MSPQQFIRLFVRNLKWLILVPAVLGVSIFYFTRGEKKLYSSETTIYTGIASGYTLNGSNKVDFYSTNNAFDNLLSIINSRETKEAVAIQLLAKHLQLPKHDPNVLSWESWKDLKKEIPANVKSAVVKGSLPETISAITAYMNSNETNVVYKLVNSENAYYSLNALKNIKSQRINTSDLIKITYETNDATICKTTLELVNDIFVKKQSGIREGQTESVVKYFAEETQRALRKLDSSENLFLHFNVDNDIINYYEQTKSIAGERENLYALNNVLEMEKKAQDYGLTKVNDNIKGRNYQAMYGNELIGQKERLSDVYNKIAYKEMIGLNKGANDKAEIDSLKTESLAIESNIRNSLGKLYVQTNTPNGIPTKNMLDEWVKATLALEQGKARLTVMDNRKKEFQDEYRKMAPLGATLKKIERQIAVSEQEYMELLHGLNLARLAQQNNELTSKLSVIDPPFLPLKPNASKRLFQVIIGGIAGFVVVLAILLVKFLTNKTLQQPVKAGKQIGLQMLGLYPLLTAEKTFVEQANMRILQQFFSKFTFGERPVVIGVCSTIEGEGKSTLIQMLRQQLTRLSYRVEHANWSGTGEPDYDPRADIVFVEISSLDKLVLTPGKIPMMNQAIMLCSANRMWTKVDKNLLEIFIKVTKVAPLLVLNGVDVDYAEEYVGKLTKKKSKILSFLKPTPKLANVKKYA